MQIEPVPSPVVTSENTPQVLLAFHPNEANIKYSIQEDSIHLEESPYLGNKSGCETVKELIRSLKLEPDTVQCKIFTIPILLDQPILLEVTFIHNNSKYHYTR